MKTNEYYMPTEWRIKGKVREVYDICSNFPDYQRWWPDVYLNIRTAGFDAETGNEVYALLTRGKLPYKLKWNSCKTSETPPHMLSLKASGDLAGRGTWRFKQDGDHVNVRFDWYVNAEKPMLKYLSWIMKPIFRSNHYWAMNIGLESLKRELERRRTAAGQ
ncbi:SRPBCC family protein [Cohnella zeiphila]|uniref:SRPBCC family protein n=1 Tax=Cohnella zeiphila TaxID=2761120 RepID=A0A7X0SHA8_9BACL|nr:SRPBCC family protein [Cohnella zeiphila]MBB6729836.1 SRPBCC family protein [Cohnella zeiphila]